MDILFRIRGGLDLAFQLATANGRSAKKLFIIKLIMNYTESLTIFQMKLRDKLSKIILLVM